ncbi:MAG: ABC transporter permease [Clostridiales bacterium]|nr:ABC transporter permease [Clostridiales bacterium]
MHKFILRRLLMMIPVLLGVVLVTFTLLYISPGCPARNRLGEQATPEAIIQLRAEMGLEDPFIVQFGRYIAGVVTLDFGNSFRTDQPFFDEILIRFPTTLHLAGMAVVLSLLIGIPLGIISAMKQYSWADAGATFLGLLFVSIPNFWLGMILLLIFAVELGVLPSLGWSAGVGTEFSNWHHWILPTITIGASAAAIIMRMTRSSMLEVVRQDYIRTARAKGQTPFKIIFKHSLKNALIPVTTVAGLQFGFLLGGAILTETIFSINGVGRFMMQAILNRDSPVVLGVALLLAFTFSIVNLLVDILYAFIDPRIRSQYR